MNIGIPREIKVMEGRVALIPEACHELVRAGHKVSIESDAGKLSAYTNQQYQAVGVEVLASAQEVYAQAELIVKVKEPLPEELALLRSDHILFSFLHLAANKVLTQALQDIGLTAIAFETVERDTLLPLLAPMSSIAGIVAAQTASNLLFQHQGGRGILLGGSSASARANAVVLGAGVAGSAAIGVLAALGANVTVFDKNTEKLDNIRQLGNVNTEYAYQHSIMKALQTADLLIGAVLVPGAKAPQIVSTDMVATMPEASIILDISVDQGGCIETIHPTTYAEPVYIEQGVLHYAVSNIPGAVPRTATQALCAVLLPYVLALANKQVESAPGLLSGYNIQSGEVIHKTVAEALAS
ncbi:Alanine dehydrogenase [hydrothermal vent metagenome]|uniref:alanine dehydrogenase n=1 Tax=hydrothermal vent metagenome TaxID=652676 RepID=A0A3B0Y6D0_9ZZZZ